MDSLCNMLMGSGVRHGSDRAAESSLDASGSSATSCCTSNATMVGLTRGLNAG